MSKKLNKILLSVLISVTLLMSALVYYNCIYVADIKALVVDYYKPNCQKVYEQNCNRLSYLTHCNKQVRSKLKVLPQAYEISSVVDTEIISECYDKEKGTAIIVAVFHMDNGKYIQVTDIWNYTDKKIVYFERSNMATKLKRD